VTNFAGPIVFVVISRYHGGAFVVFSKELNENLEVAAVEGSYASVIGGAPAAAVVFARELQARVQADPRVVEATRRAEAAASQPGEPREALDLRALTEAVRSEKLGEVAEEFDQVHSIDRALEVGSVDRIIPAALLRPYLVEAIERGIARVPRAPVGRSDGDRQAPVDDEVDHEWDGVAPARPGGSSKETGGSSSTTSVTSVTTVSRKSP
jgi:acetyl-CoA carboxylase carboxyltransferase component